MGKSIRVHLPDGSASGIRHAQIDNWTGQALVCPRTKFQEASEWAQLKRPGVYFLFGFEEDSSTQAVYIGEAEQVFVRLTSHFAQKEFWTEFVAFTNKDDYLTKGHVRYLESRLVTLARAAQRYEVKNIGTPQLPSLPRADCDSMEEYLESAKILLGIVGHRVLDPLVEMRQTNTLRTTDRPVADYLADDDATADRIFMLNVQGLVARATATDEGLVVLKGSEAAMNTQSSISPGYLRMREQLSEAGTLALRGEKRVFVKDQLFKSPSQAAAVIVGYAINGRFTWRLPDGRSFGQFEDEVAEAMKAEI